MSHSVEIDSKEAWGGGQSPFRLSYGKIFMWFFLVSDALTFGGLLISYGFIRHKYAEVWPKAENVFTHFPFVEQHIPLAYVGLMTFILIMSSVTIVLAVEAGHRMAKKEVAMYMVLTILGGAAFLGCQAWEWTTFIGEGARLYGNPYGPRSFAALFFIVTGFHGFHVFSGVVLNVIIYLNVLNGTYEKRGHYEMVEKVGLYWHFVDLVWVFVFTFFYLI